MNDSRQIGGDSTSNGPDNELGREGHALLLVRRLLLCWL